MKYVLSIMAMPVSYTFYEYPTQDPNVKAGSGPLPHIRKQIKIHGGAGLASLSSGFGDMSKSADGAPMWTPAGVVTPVSDSDFEELMKHRVFKSHLDGGVIKVINHDITGNHKAVSKEVTTMEKDPFAPLTSATADKRIKITAGAPEDDDETQKLFRI